MSFSKLASDIDLVIRKLENIPLPIPFVWVYDKWHST